MADRVVVQRPDWSDEAMKWGSWWMKEHVVKPAQSAGFIVADLYANDATRTKVLNECNKSDFVYFSGLGHGNETTFTGQQTKKIFWKGDSKTCSISQGKHFNFLSCRFGKEGAKWMARNSGAFGVHGYNADFIFVIDRGRFPNSYAKPFFDAHTTVDRELLNGARHIRAHRACLRRYIYWVFRAPSICQRYLIWDMRHKVFYGRRWKRIKTRYGGLRRLFQLLFGRFFQ